MEESKSHESGENQLAQLLILDPTMTQQEQKYFLQLNYNERAAEIKVRLEQRDK